MRGIAAVRDAVGVRGIAAYQGFATKIAVFVFRCKCLERFLCILEAFSVFCRGAYAEEHKKKRVVGRF